jgi:hypothetical protein
MQKTTARKVFRATMAVWLFGTAVLSGPLWAQQFAQPAASFGVPPAQYSQPPAGEQAPVPLTPDQLDNLVAPVALYPDSLLSELLAASTYPLEIVDAEQWLLQNRNLPAAQRMDAAKQQNWDPSIQALVAFPDILDILGRDIRWTTDLGNVFLGQQGDVMNAIQTLRARAQQSGRLESTPQQIVTTEGQGVQSAIQIAPADPQMIYPPVYDPYAVWGPPVYGAYPSLWYPPAWGYRGGGGGIGFAPGTFIGSLFSGLLSFGGWGWGLNWLTHSLLLNLPFLGHFFNGYGGGYGGGIGGGYGASAIWVHDPGHRLGVPYASREVASHFGGRFNGGGAGAAAPRGFTRPEAPRSQAEGAWRSPGTSARATPAAQSFRGGGYSSTGQFAARAAPQAAVRPSFEQSRSASGSYNRDSYNSYAPAQSYRGSTGFRQSQSFAAPRVESNRSPSQAMTRSFSKPHSQAPRYSAPRDSGGSRAPHTSSSHGSTSHVSSSRGSSHGSSSHGSSHSKHSRKG